MSDAEFQIQALGDVRLADHATGALPAWLWAADGARILWANPVGAKVFGAANGAELAKRSFGPADPHRRQVARLGHSLNANGAVRLERLRGFGAAPGMLATCGCARIDLPDGSHGILMTTLNATGRGMPLAERLLRLLQGLPRPAAAFTSDGLLVATNEAARALPGLHDLTEAGLEAARGEALAQGRAAASVAIGRVVLQRIGHGADRALVALIKPAPHLAARPAAPIAPEPVVPEPVAPAASEAPVSPAVTPPEPAATEPPPAPIAVDQQAAHHEAPASASEAPATFTLFDALDPTPEEAAAPIISATEPDSADAASSPAPVEAAPVESAAFDTTPDATAAVEEPLSEALIDVPAEARVEEPADLAPSLASAEQAHAETAPLDTTPDETPAVEEPLSEALIDVPAEARVEQPEPEPAPDLEETANAPEASAPPADPAPSPYAVAETPAPAAEPEPATLAPVPPPSWLDEPLPVRRHPLRFMWQMDHGARFSLGSDEFTRLIGLHTAAGFGRLWSDIAESFGLDPEGRVMQAFASHDTWSGITLHWPVDGGGRLPVELSGLPVFDRARNFAGYRGFGVCRDLDGLARLAALRRYEFFSGTVAPKSLSADVAPAPRSDAPPGPAAPPDNPPPHAEPPPDTTAIAPPEELTEPTAAETSHRADPDHAVETHEETHEVRHDPPPNVVPFRPAGDTRPPSLTPVENNAFNELARQLSARLENEAGLAATTNDSVPAEPLAEAPPASEPPQEAAAAPQETVAQLETPAETPKASWLAAAEPAPRADSRRDCALLDLLPVGVLIYRLDRLLYANHAFLARMGHDSLHALEAAGGLDALYVEPGVSQASSTSGTGTPVTISANQSTEHGAQSVSAEARLHTITWDDDSALALIFSRTLDEDAAIAAALSEPEPAAEPLLAPAEPQAGQADAEELGAILDTAAEGIIMFDAEGNIHSCNRSAEALFGYDGDEFVTRKLADLFAPESQHGIFDYLSSLKSAGVTSLLDHGRETLGRVRQGGIIPLSVTMGRTRADGPNFFAVFRDLSQTRKSEGELREARRLAERAANAKSDMLARISHELRTPLNAIIGFAEVMIGERFGALGNERYVEYMKDIRASGERVIAIVNDLLDLSRIETGKLDLAFASQNLNEMVESCVAVMQPQANRERIIIRTSLAHTLPPVVADARALRQITLNLIGNSIHLANAGGQVIVSTALSDFGEVMLRVRDTGQSLNDNEVAAALEPFRAPTPSDQAGSGGVSLSLTKALVEANRAKFQIRTGGRTGTLIEVTFVHAAARA
ncbi:PAS domain S-box-containing protein [Bradyrhizobium elkanii USDA 61]|uniref:histidine kinase n=1 Tax=Bradyrhizobium elkanii TaxID=29448 RepID=A0A8I2C611_BRAEL|nr:MULTISPECIES: histidine kinase dimerization/phospho-acceptor domain-containing protein [Bradyrhizobium]MBP1293886.1 PAS domain S-box-containing protein [Bradyrhizobium elkanii]MCP1925530.1 PAS domain S-box-containing protein [Bradyrhizobium elkanii]MCS3476977.1 PAS domain S-box-containing protein [Bradyrhizobium elkanii]MCS3583715.1 PAS domain S-box-containing protein [Bradyrhizobium elkanii]MCS3717285.1 PAS domain S-box-containing protein [Bradyrhizobium elkanii]